MAQSNLEVSNGALIKLGEKTITSLAVGTKAADICTARVDICKRSVLRMHPWNFAVKRTNLEPSWVAITGAISGTGGVIRLLTASTTGLSAGLRVTVHEVTGTTEANGTFTISAISANVYIELADTTFTNTYVSDGEWTLAATFDFTYSIALPSDNLRILRVNDQWSDPCWRIEGGRLLTDNTENFVKYVYDVTDYTTMSIDFYECLALYLAWDICLAVTGDKERVQLLYEEFRRMLAKARHSDATEDPAENIEANEWLDSRIHGASVGADRSYWGMAR